MAFLPGCGTSLLRGNSCLLLLQNNYACLDLEEREVCLGVTPKAGLTSFGLEGDERKVGFAKLKTKQNQMKSKVN